MQFYTLVDANEGGGGSAPGLFLGPEFSAEVCHHTLMECNPRI